MSWGNWCSWSDNRICTFNLNPYLNVLDTWCSRSDNRTCTYEFEPVPKCLEVLDVVGMGPGAVPGAVKVTVMRLFYVFADFLKIIVILSCINSSAFVYYNVYIYIIIFFLLKVVCGCRWNLSFTGNVKGINFLHTGIQASTLSGFISWLRKMAGVEFLSSTEVLNKRLFCWYVHLNYWLRGDIKLCRGTLNRESIRWLVGHYFLKGREVTLPCSYRSTCLHLFLARTNYV